MSYYNSAIKRSEKLAFKKEIKYSMDKKKYATALEKIDQFLEIYPKDIYASVCKAIIYGKQKQEDMAIKLFESLVKSSTNDKEMKVLVYKEYGKYLSTLKRNDKAIHYFKLAIEESNQKEIDTRLFLSRLYSHNKDLDSAIDCLTIDGFDGIYLKVKRAALYYRNRKYDKVLYELRNVNRKNIKSDFIRQEYDYLCGSVYQYNGDFEQARYYLELCTCTKNTNYYHEALTKLAIIDLLFDNSADALLKCKLILNSSNSSFSVKERAICTLGNAYLKICDYDSAEEAFKMLPDKYNRKLLEMGRLNLYANKLEKAEEFLESFIECNKNKNYEALYLLALTKFRLKKHNEACKIINDVLAVAGQEENKNELHQISFDLKRLRLVIDIINNKPIKRKCLSNHYVEKQIISYSKDASINHIKTHHGKNAKVSRFDDDIVIEELFCMVKNSLDENSKISDEVLDKYIVNLSDIGYECSNPINIIVLTIPDTKNIVNMYPFYTNVTNDDEKESSSKKVKRLSQIEKFNMKYSK